MKCPPSPGGAYGCSENAWWATTQETWGTVPVRLSALMAAAMSSGAEAGGGKHGRHSAVGQRAAGRRGRELREISLEGVPDNVGITDLGPEWPTRAFGYVTALE
ncbi:hypothetical protein [Streptomyces sp. NPDC051286]|uniref:hypothetical protein n=1 Tax=Streptomyces sp. NPDC051286 TaxID=3365647 RepID=UPI0037B8A8CD